MQKLNKLLKNKIQHGVNRTFMYALTKYLASKDDSIEEAVFLKVLELVGPWVRDADH